MTTRLALLVLPVLLALTGSIAPDQEQIRQLYRRAVAGDKAAVNECIAQLEAALKVQPANELARVHLGSAYTLRSRDLGFGSEKLQALNHGLALMDAAVTAVPNDAHVRLVRAMTTQALPFFLGRKNSTREDWEMLAGIAAAHPETLAGDDLQTIYYQAGLAAKEKGELSRALELWTAGLKYGGDVELRKKLEGAIGGQKR